jgi:hypothetical protein
MRLNPRFLPLWTSLFTLILISAGCGLKGDPIPPRIKPPAAIADLGAATSRGGVLLGWSLTDPLEKIGTFQLLRSETIRGNEACPECPQDYKRHKTIPVADPTLRRDGEKKFSYTDGDVDAGHFYLYRVVVCDRTGNCSAPSNAAGLIHTGR